MEWLAASISHVWTSCLHQLGGTFLAPGSSYSIVALTLSLGLFVILAIPAGRKRPLRLRVLVRVLFPRRSYRSASGRADIAFFVLGILFTGLLIGWAIFSADQVRQWVAGLIGNPGPARLPAWAGAAIATVTLFIAYEFSYWLDHWLMHRVPILWRFHKVHHQAESLSLLTNSRVHPLETIGFFNLKAVVLGVTGALLQRALGTGVTPVMLGGVNALVLLAAVTVTNFQHSHLWVTYGPRWGRLLLGPAHHQFHHSADPAHFNCNLGSSLALFDRLFGTFHMPTARRSRLRFGVEDGTPNPHGAHAALIAPFLPTERLRGILQPAA